MRYLTIALAKGRLALKAMDMFEQIGISCEEMKDKNSRKLIFVNEDLGIRFFLAKANDVPTYVEYGAADTFRGAGSDRRAFPQSPPPSSRSRVKPVSHQPKRQMPWQR